MGMFEKDKAFAPGGRLDDVYKPGEVDEPAGDNFILWDGEIKDEHFETDIGEATMTWLLCSNLNTPDEKVWLGTLAKAIADKVRAKGDPDPDLPAIVQVRRVTTPQNPALVLQFQQAYKPEKKGK